MSCSGVTGPVGHSGLWRPKGHFIRGVSADNRHARSATSTTWAITRARAFTLIELLVVVAILALVISIMLPSFGQVMKASNSARCLSNLRQWGMAANMYVIESKGFLPRRGQGVRPTMQVDRRDDWFNALPPLMKMERFSDRVNAGRPPKPGEDSVWSCPVAAPVEHPFFFAYGMNMMLSTWLEADPVRLDATGPSESTVFLADGPGTHCSLLPSFESYSPVARHRERTNIVFLDAHAASFHGDYVGCGRGDPHRHDVRWQIRGSDWPEPGQPQ